MVRFFTFAGFSLLAGLGVAATIGPHLSWWAGLGFLCLLAMALGLMKWKKMKLFSPLPVTLFFVSLAFLLYVNSFNHTILPLAQLPNTKALITGTLEQPPQPSAYGLRAQLRVNTVTNAQGEPLPLPPFGLQLHMATPLSAQPGDEIQCGVKFFSLEQGGLYSSVNTGYAKGEQLGGVLMAYGGFPPLTVTPCKGLSLAKILNTFRQSLSRAYSSTLPASEASLLQAMVLGDTVGLEEQVESAFRQSGCSHLLVVSGLHLSAVVGFLSLLLRPLRKRHYLRTLLLGAGACAFAALTGFSPSVLRSLILVLLTLGADLFFQEADGLNSLGLAVGILCLGNPFLGGSLSFALSVLSTLGILALYPLLDQHSRHWLRGKLEKLPSSTRNRKGDLLIPRPLLLISQPVLSSFCLSFSVMITTFPVNFFAFEGMTLLSPLTNLLALFPSTLLLYGALPGAALFLIPGLQPLATPFLLAAGLLARLLLVLTRFLARLPGFFLSYSPSLLLCLCVAVFLLFLMLPGKKSEMGEKPLFTKNMQKQARIQAITAAACICAVLSFSPLLCTVLYREQLTVILANPRGVLCAVLVKGQQAAVLSPGSPGSTVLKELLYRQNVREITAFTLPPQLPQGIQAAASFADILPPQYYLLPGQSLSSTFPFSAEVAPLKERGTQEVLPGVMLQWGKGLLTFSYGDAHFALELLPYAQSTASWDVLITSQIHSAISSRLTVLQTEEPTGAPVPYGKSGTYLPLPTTRTITFRLPGPGSWAAGRIQCD